MKKYDVNPVSTNDEDFYWQLYEIASERIIATFPFREDAQKAADWMDKGGAFNGFTPGFILINTNTIDEKFEKAFQ